MPQTIKVSGIPDELVRRLDERWRAAHYSDRSEYIRELLRRDLATSLGDLVSQTFGAPFADLNDEEIERDVKDAISEVRAERRKRPIA